MTDQRKPAVFRLDAEPVAEQAKPASRTHSPRRPATIAPPQVIEQPDAFDLEAVPDTVPAAAPPARSRWTAAGIFAGAVGLLVSLALGLWVDNLVRSLFARADWLGYAALALVAAAVAALVIIVARELAGLARLGAAARLRDEAAEATKSNDMGKARALTEKLETLFASVPQTARGRALLKQTHGEILDGRDLIRLAETDVLGPLDRMAQAMVMESAKRVSVVTAVSPRALIDVGYVIYESARLIRRLAELYGGRPGTFGLLRLSRRVLAHLAVTGSIAVGDSIVQQLVGHGLAARLSARLGEGVINGLMTARVGIAAMDIVRPMPFDALKRPGIGDFLSELTRISGSKPPAV